MAGESRVGLIGEAGFAPADEAGAGVDVAADAAGHGTEGSGAEAGEREAACEGEGAACEREGAGAGGAGVAGAAADAGAAGEDADPEAEAAARELAEHNALADVFDDVRRMSADSHLVTPDRWPAIGLVPDHMTAEDFEMFVYEWLEDYQAEHSDEIAAEIAAEKAKAASVRSATHAVGVPPKIPNRRLAQIEADNAAEQNKEAAAGEAVAGETAAEGGKAAPDDAVATAADSTGDSSLAAAGVSDVASSGSVEREDAAVASISAPADAAGGESGPAAAAAASAPADNDNDNSPFAGLKIPEGYRLEQIEGEWVLVEDEDAAPVRKEIRCNRIKVLMGMHSYYLYDQTLMTDNYARWAFLAAEDNPQVTFVECVREDSRVYPRPYAAECLRNPPFSMTDEQIRQTWEAVRDSGNYPDIGRTVASNGDVYYYSTDYLDAGYAAALAEYDAVERPANV